MPPSTRPSPRAPRRGERELRAALLAAATEVFLEHGYRSASLDDIVERAGGSKRAVYDYFGGKRELFTAIIAANARRALPLPPPGLHTENPELYLTEFATRILGVVAQSEIVMLYRIIIAEGPRQPELARTFYSVGPGAAAEHLATQLRLYVSSGKLNIDECDTAAETFMGMLRGDLHLMLLLDIAPAPSPDQLRLRAERVVRIFLTGTLPT